MKHKTKIKVTSFLLIIVSLTLFTLGVIWTYFNIIEPAYVSTVSSCTEFESSDFGYVTVGTYNYSSNEIAIYNPTIIPDESYKLTREYEITLNHELCHQKQRDEGRLSGCGVNVFGFSGARFTDELECYIKQYF